MITFDSSRPIDVVPVGRIAIDFNPVNFNEPFTACTTFNKYVGGSPANTAAGLSHLGIKTGFIGKVSNDSLGDYVVGYLEEQGVDISHISRCQGDETLGLAFTETRADGSTNLMMYRSGPVADLQLSPEEIDEEYIKKAKCVVISGTALAASPSREAVFKVLELAEKNQCVIVFDIDYRPQTWKSDDEISIYYTLAAKYADIIMGSREEFDRMDSMTASSDYDDWQTADHWFKQRAKIVIIKHGKEGSRVYCSDNSAYQVKPFPVKALKATGGGDAYSSAFLAGLLKNFTIQQSLEMATASASMVIASPSCSSSMPDFESLESFINESREAYGQVITKIEKDK